MKSLATLSAVAIAATLFSTTSFADGREPGSVLVYPSHRSGLGSFPTNQGAQFTVINITNTTLAGGNTNVELDYVNMSYGGIDATKLLPTSCTYNDQIITLTPGDTYSVHTRCKNGNNQQGYVVAYAQDPALFKTAWSWNYLIGSELVITPTGGVYQLDALPFTSPMVKESLTDHEGDGDGQLDFDNIEYEGMPDVLYIDNVLAVSSNSLVLINFTGGTGFTAVVKFDVWNNNEDQFSFWLEFKCWFEIPLYEIDSRLTDNWLFLNTNVDPTELDADCLGAPTGGDYQTFWAMITPQQAWSNVETIPDPAILGAITAPPFASLEGAKSLWESGDQTNGDFLKFGHDDLEYPPTGG